MLLLPIAVDSQAGAVQSSEEDNGLYPVAKLWYLVPSTVFVPALRHSWQNAAFLDVAITTHYAILAVVGGRKRKMFRQKFCLEMSINNSASRLQQYADGDTSFVTYDSCAMHSVPLSYSDSSSMHSCP